MSRPTVCTCVNGVVDWGTHDRVIGAPFICRKGGQGKGVAKRWGVCWGPHGTKVMRHDAGEAARQSKRGRGRVVQQDVLLEVRLIRQRYLTQVAETGGGLIALRRLRASTALRVVEAAAGTAAYHRRPWRLEL